MYGVRPRGHLQGQTRDNSNTRFFTLKRNTYTCVLIGTRSQSPGFIYQTTDVSAFASAVVSDYKKRSAK